jgi:hypothetical protein
MVPRASHLSKRNHSYDFSASTCRRAATLNATPLRLGGATNHLSPITNHVLLLAPFPPRETRRIAGRKRFLECFIHFLFQVPIFVVHFLVRSIRAHGI